MQFNETHMKLIAYSWLGIHFAVEREKNRLDINIITAHASSLGIAHSAAILWFFTFFLFPVAGRIFVRE